VTALAVARATRPLVSSHQEKPMHCPRCETVTLTEMDRDGVTIDRCARCRGIWLDRGELEKLIARGANGGPARAAADDDDDDRGRERDRGRRDHDDDDDDRDRHGNGRRRSWWEIFD